ncbi:hypothetical protein Zmor_027085 [Zophobas morio]|uniref:Uncharacterized protein n=1 Tax=Zophobas morio TaxID=2755281 RepID=A0AA38HJZ8_9CUCU|nr:hypothetical protein Zmor_027085 [Zophobas morio]
MVNVSAAIYMGIVPTTCTSEFNGVKGGYNNDFKLCGKEESGKPRCANYQGEHSQLHGLPNLLRNATLVKKQSKEETMFNHVSYILKSLVWNTLSVTGLNGGSNRLELSK